MKGMCKLTMLALLLALISGCKTTQDRYTTPNADEFGVQIIGDSYWDFEGYIPTELTSPDKSGKVYFDRSRSGAKLPAIAGYWKMAQDDDAADDTYQIRTILVNGGENDMRVPCKTASQTPNPDYGIDPEAEEYLLTAACSDAIAGALASAQALVVDISSKVDHVVWLGRHYMSNDAAPRQVIDYYDDQMKSFCAELISSAGGQKPRCVFAETRPERHENASTNFYGLWTHSEASTFMLSDGIHVTAEGGKRVANVLWDTMVANDVYR